MGDIMTAAVQAKSARDQRKAAKRSRLETDQAKQAAEKEQERIAAEAEQADVAADAEARNKVRKKRLSQTKTILTTDETQGTTKKSLLGV